VNFDEYLQKKKIDSVAFHQTDPQRFEDWRQLFSEISEQSFSSQKLYLINGIRRKFPLPAEVGASKSSAATAKAKPIIKPRPKIN
jgi:hypothetical protein